MIRLETDNKRAYLPLLLEADPEETAISRYLDAGRLYVLEEDGQAMAVAVVADLGEGRCELKNIATDPAHQGRGYGGRLLRHVLAASASEFDEMVVGTTPPQLDFYRKFGFRDSHIRKNFFLENYARPIFENGVQCIDMYCLTQKLR